MQILSFLVILVLELVTLKCVAASFDTSALDSLHFYRPSLLRSVDTFITVPYQPESLNSNLWAASNISSAEIPFATSNSALEWVVNATFPTQFTNMTTVAGVATLPTAAEDSASFLGIFHTLTFQQCASVCGSTAHCVAFAYYELPDAGLLCQVYAMGFLTGPQPFPTSNVAFAQGGELVFDTAVDEDMIANGLRSGTWLGGLGTGGYEIRADGSFALSTIANQSPAGEPWQGTVRDFVLCVAVDGVPFLMRTLPLHGGTGSNSSVPPTPYLIYSASFPVARLQTTTANGLDIAVYAHSALTPGDEDLSNTPAIAFTLRASIGKNDTATRKITFFIAAALGLRNDWRQASSGGIQPISSPVANVSACALACAAVPACRAWEWQAETLACSIDEGHGYALGSYSLGLDSGFSGMAVVTDEGVTFITPTAQGEPILHSGLGEQSLFVPPQAFNGSNVSSATGASDSMDSLLALLFESSPTMALRTKQFALGGAGALFCAASVTAESVTPGDVISLSIIHAWRYPVNYWYRDAHNGSDVGVRYASVYPTAIAAAKRLNLTLLSAGLLSWQAAFAGLPHALLIDGVANMLNHVRSAMWLASGEFRQWESLEFIDFGNPTNGDERHLLYFAYWPLALRSQLLLTWFAHTQRPDGMFYCVLVSGLNDAQWGNGDPCGPTDRHPDDIAMILVAVAEALLLRNDTTLVTQIYPRLLLSFEYYITNYNSTPWHLPFRVHESYDAVKIAENITGEGNWGTSLFNALQYVNALNCMREIAEFSGDDITVNAAAALIVTATTSIQSNFFQPLPNLYIGDTLSANVLFTEPNGWPYHSSDSLHGQVLAYRLGFSELLPMTQAQLHQQFVVLDLNYSSGLSFSHYSRQNWMMADHANSALQLRWGQEGAWDTTLRQLRLLRDVRKDGSRAPAVVDAESGAYMLLNHYGYALFFFHTLSAFTGLTAHLPHRSITFNPHPSAFFNTSAAGTAILPVLLGGAVGTLSLTPTTATLSFAFLSSTSASGFFSFVNITVCQHVFINNTGFTVGLELPLTLTLPSPCNAASPNAASHTLETLYCKADVSNSTSGIAWSLSPRLPTPILGINDLTSCIDYTVKHHFCGYEWSQEGGGCVGIPGIGCFLTDAPGSLSRERGAIHCDYSSVITPPSIINATALPIIYSNVTFGNNFIPIDSPVFTMALRSGDECMSLSAVTQSCGWLWTNTYTGSIIGGCGGGVAGGGGCCALNPYRGCVVGGAEQGWGDSVLGIWKLAGAL